MGSTSSAQVSDSETGLDRDLIEYNKVNLLESTMGRLDNKTAVVTGSTGGIGRAIAEAYAREGARVVVNGRRGDIAEEVAAGIRSPGGEAVAVEGDVSSKESADAIVEAAISEWGRIDIVVNNAAISGPIAPIGEDDLDWWMDTLRINVLGAYLVTRAAVPHMKQVGGGKIIDISSGANRGMSGDLLPYRVSKAGLLRLSTALAAQLQPHGIQVNTVDVYATTPMVVEIGTWDDQSPVLAARMRERAAGVGPTPEENTPIFVWLASTASDGLYGRNFAWNMDTSDLDRLKQQIMADERSLRMEMVDVDGIGLSATARAYEERLRGR
jgi:NAD(P)-dependent dehydrogenase (short-subunit alcohol dehydrogenase family)